MYKAILYDLDGTLLDTANMNMVTLQRIILEERGEHWTFEQVRPFYAQAGMKTMSDLNISNRKEVYDRWVRYVNEYPEGATPYPGVEEMLEAVESRGLVQAAVSSKRRDQYRIDVVGHGLDRFMAEAVLEDDTPFHKPDPRPLQICLERLGLRAEEALYVGDSPSDCVAAHAAGMDFAFAGWGITYAHEIPGPDYILNTPADLLKLL